MGKLSTSIHKIVVQSVVWGDVWTFRYKNGTWSVSL